MERNKETRAMQERSGWGVRVEDDEESINEALEHSTGAWKRYGDMVWGKSM